MRPLQKHFVNNCFVFAWEFCIEKWRGFLVNFFSGLRFPRNEARKFLKNSGKIRREIRGKIRGQNSKNSENFRSATFLTLRSLRGSTSVLWGSTGFSEGSGPMLVNLGSAGRNEPSRVKNAERLPCEAQRTWRMATKIVCSLKVISGVLKNNYSNLYL